MFRKSTLLLKAALLAFGIIALSFGIFAAPIIVKEIQTYFPEYPYIGFAVIFYCISSLSLFLFALYQGFLLLIYIDKDEVFNDKSVKVLKTIKICGLIIGGVYITAMPVIYLIAEKDDAPGLILIGAFITLIPFVIAAFSGLLAKPLKKAVDIKIENDLTV